MQRVWIDGAWLEVTGRPGRTIHNPATLEPIEAIPDCGATEVERALESARRARASWRSLGPEKRAGPLREAAEAIGAAAGELAGLSTRETGTPILESLDALAIVVALFREAADGGHLAGPPGAGREMQDSAPRRVLPGAHYPLLDLAARIAPVLAAGETVVCRASPTAPLASLALAQCLAALPAGVLGVVTGGEDTAAALLDHPEVAARAAPSARIAPRPEVLVVPRDADLELAAAGSAAYRLFNSGQRPALCPTVYVEEPLASAFVERLHLYLAFLEVGDPIKPVTDLGPLVSAAAAAALETQVAHALKRGGKLVLGARRFQPWGLMGYFFQPTLFTRARPDMSDLDEQIQGPVLAICPVEDLAETLAHLLRARGAHLTVLGGEPERVLAGLARAAPERLRRAPRGAAERGGHPLLERVLAHVRVEAHSPLAVRDCALIDVEHVSTPAPWWFPYAGRRR